MAKSSIPQSVRKQVREFLKSIAAEVPAKPKSSGARARRGTKAWLAKQARAKAWNKIIKARYLLAEARKHGISASKTGAGVARRAIIADTFVVKLSRFAHDHHRLVEEAEFINDCRRHGYADNFPETHVIRVKGVTALVQERVDMSHAWVNRLGWENRVKARQKMYDIAESLRIGDMHDGNYGWRKLKNGTRVPVLVDVDYRDGHYGSETDSCDY